MASPPPISQQNIQLKEKQSKYYKKGFLEEVVNAYITRKLPKYAREQVIMMKNAHISDLETLRKNQRASSVTAQ